MDFDDTALAGLQDALPDAEFRELLSDYLASTAARMAKVQVLRAAQNWNDLAFEAHTLVSTGGGYGLVRASTLARSLQEACKAGDADQASALAVELVAATTRGCEALRSRFLGGRTAAAA
ncbi:MAG TPA: Hpt domain-containing protein [Alphaproteobacteria bacterium]|nr:Hpt domain-containing protein [Alphaproteobacteria bacterium]